MIMIGYRGVARIFQRGVTLCESEGTSQLTSKISSWHFHHLLWVVWLKKACKGGGHGLFGTPPPPLATPLDYTYDDDDDYGYDYHYHG